MDDYCYDCASNRCDCYPDECPVKYPQGSSAASLGNDQSYPNLSAAYTTWRSLCREVPRLGWAARIALALHEACDLLEERDAEVVTLRKKLVAAQDFMRPKG